MWDRFEKKDIPSQIAILVILVHTTVNMHIYIYTCVRQHTWMTSLFIIVYQTHIPLSIKVGQESNPCLTRMTLIHDFIRGSRMGVSNLGTIYNPLVYRILPYEHGHFMDMVFKKAPTSYCRLHISLYSLFIRIKFLLVLYSVYTTPWYHMIWYSIIGLYCHISPIIWYITIDTWIPWYMNWIIYSIYLGKW